MEKPTNSGLLTALEGGGQRGTTGAVTPSARPRHAGGGRRRAGRRSGAAPHPQLLTPPPPPLRPTPCAAVRPFTRSPLPASLATDSPCGGDTGGAGPTGALPAGFASALLLPPLPTRRLRDGERAVPATPRRTHRHSRAAAVLVVYLGPAAAACAAFPGTSGLSTTSARPGMAPRPVTAVTAPRPLPSLRC